jgi:hypothetical protein
MFKYLDFGACGASRTYNINTGYYSSQIDLVFTGDMGMLNTMKIKLLFFNILMVKTGSTANPKNKRAKAKPKQSSPQTKLKTKTHAIKTKKKLVKKTRLKKRSTTVTPKPKKEQEVPDEVKWMQEDPHDQLLSRFVETPKGTRVGESIGIEQSRIILKNKLNFYVIPLKYIKEKDDKLILRRKVNWDRAAKLGEAWRKKALDVIPKNKPKRKKGKIRKK